MVVSTQVETADIRIGAVATSEDELFAGLGTAERSRCRWLGILASPTPEQRPHCEVSGAGFGIRWPDLG